MDSYFVAAIFAVAASGAIAAYWWTRSRAFARRALAAERRFELLQDLAPSLTDVATQSAAKTCARILDRVLDLIPAPTAMCFAECDGRLIVGAKHGGGELRFLREGDPYSGGSIVDWVRERGRAAIVGPDEADIPTGIDVADFSRAIRARFAGPAVGSRDRVWALAIPLARNASHGPISGILYLERGRGSPFAPDELRTALTVSRLCADALARALFADEIRRDAAIDGLTALLTPQAFRRGLRYEVGPDKDVALFFIDTDHFKALNDSHGHAAGDRLLRKLASMFSEVAALSGGFAGRNGGDEFCIALPDRTKDAAVEIAERIRADVAALDLHAVIGVPESPAVEITVSVGVAHHPVDVEKSETQPADRLLEIADSQMYAAKRGGRNRVEYLRAGIRNQRELAPGESPIPRR